MSRDPIGEFGGANVYNFVEQQPLGNVDLFGLKVRVVQAVTSGQLRQLRYQIDTKRLHLAVGLRELGSLSEAEWRSAEVFINGKPFFGSKAELIRLAEREESSEHMTATNSRDFFNAVLSIMIDGDTESHDVLVLVAHGFVKDGIPHVDLGDKEMRTTDYFDMAERFTKHYSGRVVVAACHATVYEGSEASVFTRERMMYFPADLEVFYKEAAADAEKKSCISVQFTSSDAQRRVGPLQPDDYTR